MPQRCSATIARVLRGERRRPVVPVEGLRRRILVGCTTVLVGGLAFGTVFDGRAPAKYPEPSFDPCDPAGYYPPPTEPPCGPKAPEEPPPPGPPDSELRADPGGPYTAIRTLPVGFDGSRSRGKIERYDWTFRPGEGCPKGLRLPKTDVRGARPYIVPLCGLTVRLKVTDRRGRTDAAETTLNVTPREDVFSETPVKHRDEPLLPRGRQDPRTPRGVPSYSKHFILGKNRSDCTKEEARDSILCPYVPDGRSHLGQGYTIDQLDDRGGPFHKRWYVLNTRLSVKRVGLYNPYVRPDGWKLPDLGVSWYGHNQASGNDVADFWRALLAHEGMGLGALPMAGHTGAMAAMIEGGHYDPRRAIEPYFARERAKLVESVDRRLTAVEKALDEASDDPLPRIWNEALLQYDAASGVWREQMQSVGG